MPARAESSLRGGENLKEAEEEVKEGSSLHLFQTGSTGVVEEQLEREMLEWNKG